METQTYKDITIHHSCQNPTERAADELQEILTDEQPTLFLSAGGSSLHILKELSDSVSLDDTTITVLDERVTDNQADCNFYQLRQIDSIHKQSDINFVNPLPNPTIKPKTLGRRFATKLEQWLKTHPSGQVVATVGVGGDGHIAGMIPTSKEVFANRFQTESLAVGYSDQEIDNDFKYRITTTQTFFLEYLDQAIIYAVGEKKCSVLQRLITTNTHIYSRSAELLKQTPSCLFTDCKLDVASS